LKDFAILLFNVFSFFLVADWWYLLIEIRGQTLFFRTKKPVTANEFRFFMKSFFIGSGLLTPTAA
jgi:hypothetical protein